jgi:hypothetical protein
MGRPSQYQSTPCKTTADWLRGRESKETFRGGKEDERMRGERKFIVREKMYMLR